MIIKSLEIYYDMADIPGTNGGKDIEVALAFRNEAMAHIEKAISAADIGEWEGAETGLKDVSFGFEVDDYAAAEAVINEAIAGTPYEGVRAVVRREFDTKRFEKALGLSDSRPALSLFEASKALVLRQFPTRFDQPS